MPKNKGPSVIGVVTGKRNGTLESIREHRRIRGAMDAAIRAGGSPAAAARKALTPRRKK